MTQYAEVKSDYTDDQNMTIIDAFKTGDGMEEGRQVAAVCRDTGKVIFFNNDERLNPQIREEISNVLKDIQTNSEFHPEFSNYFIESTNNFKSK